MRSGNLFVLCATLFVFAGCGDDDVCVDCADDGGVNTDADGGTDGTDSDVRPDGDGETREDGDGETANQYSSLTVNSVPVTGASIELDGDPSGQVTNWTFENLPAREHSVLLSCEGRPCEGRLPVPDGCTGLPCPAVTVNVPPEGTAVNIFLGWNLTGRWRREGDGLEVNVEMWHRDRILAYPPTAACPDTELVAHGFSPLGAICLDREPPDTLSLCRTHAPECGGTYATGRILEDGRRVEVDAYLPSFCPACDQHLVFVKVD